jgi:hypothetical protein
VAQQLGVLRPEPELELSKLHGLEPGGGVEQRPEAEEVLGPHRLQHPNLVHQQALDLDGAA